MAEPVNTERQRLFSTREAAAYLGVSERTMWTLGNSGQMPRVSFGAGTRKIVRFDLADLDAFVGRNKRGCRR